MKHKPIFVTGIGTGVGKTITSALIVEHLQADYWKPVQSGDLDNTDTDRVKELISNTRSIFHPEAYRLTQPFSPHKSAALDGISITLDAIELPLTDNWLIIEGAGGLMVPLNENDLILDLIEKFNAEVVLVSQNYLGSINHTLLSLELLKSRGIPLRALVICGEENTDSEGIIRVKSGTDILHIPFFEPLNKQIISSFSKEFVL